MLLTPPRSSTPATTAFMVLLIGVLVVTAQAQDNALHDSARAGDKAKFEMLLAAGADPNAVDDRGWTPLHRASLGGGHADIATLLLSRGASVGARDKQGRTPLHVAGHDGSNDVARLLLANGADIDAMDQYSTTPLDVAIASDRSGQKGILELLESHILGPAEPRRQLARLTEKIRITSGDKKTRWLAIRLANRMQPRPVVPEEAQRAFVRAELLQQIAKNTSDHERAISAYRSALRVAP